MKKSIISIILTYQLISSLNAQTISAIKVKQHGDKISIKYTLDVPSKETSKISLQVSSDGGYSFDIIPISVTGDIGENISEGKKEMEWEPLKDGVYLSSNDCVFKVSGSTKLLPKAVDTTKVEDIEGNSYPVSKIGTQTWMTENLRVERYNDGKQIYFNDNNQLWINSGKLKKGAYCWYKNDSKYKEEYGALYNKYVVDTKKICPIGWHVPSDKEWTVLINFVGGELKAGKILKNKKIWDKLIDGDNIYNFNGVLGGNRLTKGEFSEDIHHGGYWWCSTSEGDKAWSRMLYFNNNSVYRSLYSHSNGFSIRCIKN